jgi:hypothetical protein
VIERVDLDKREPLLYEWNSWGASYPNERAAVA